MIRVYHVVPSLEAKLGGPSRSIPSLHDALQRIDVDSLIVTASGGHEADESQCISSNKRMTPVSGLLQLWTESAQRRIPDLKGADDKAKSVVHVHGCWHVLGHLAVWIAKKRGIPVVIQPRGMLEPWAMGFKPLKKNLAMLAYQRADLESAAAIVATADSEKQSVVELGIRAPVYVVPNGVRLPCQNQSAARFRSKHNVEILYIGRLHPKKGLLMLLDAVRSLPSRAWSLTIAGTGDAAYERQLKKVVSDYGLGERVVFVGQVDGVRKSDLFIKSDFLVLPTFSENFGMSVAEALAYGVPVISTKGAPWSDLVRYRAGWWTETSPESIAAALWEAMELDIEAYAGFSARASQLARQYSWERSAMSMKSIYDRISDRSSFGPRSRSRTA